MNGGRKERHERKNIFDVLAVIVGVLVVWMMFPYPWLSFTDKNKVIGTYYTLEACKRNVSKRGGGWCGNGCVQYDFGTIANCTPLVKVSK
jgi:hypothetical protein